MASGSRKHLQIMRLGVGLLLPLVAFLGCTTTGKPAQSTATAPKSGGPQESSRGVTTALPVTPLQELPAGYTLDTRVQKDAARNYTATLHVPRAVDDAAFNLVMDAFVRQQVEAEQPDADATEATTLEVWILEARVTGQVTQWLFRAQSYTEGAAHYNHGFLTLNYDAPGKKQVLFTDLFVFSKGPTAQAFCDLINRHEQGLEAGETPNGGLTPQELGAKLNFEVRDQKLVIYPNRCCADEGKTHGLDLSTVKAFLDPAVAGNFGL